GPLPDGRDKAVAPPHNLPEGRRLPSLKQGNCSKSGFAEVPNGHARRNGAALTGDRPMYRLTLAVSALALALSACSPSKPATPPAPHQTGVDKAGMDAAVKPGDDFFLYANGAWDKATEIPADRSSWGGNAILGEQVDKDVRAIIEGASTSAAPG